jgi:hypothetical protein
MGVTALGAAGYNAVTGDLCSMVGSCAVACDGEKTACSSEGEAKVVVAAAKDGEAKACCALGAVAKEASAKSDCSKTCDGAAKTINAAASSDCSKTCDGAAKTINASAEGDGCCKSGAKTIAVAAGSDCSKSCDGGAKTVNAAAGGDCASSCSKGGAQTIAVAGSEGGTCATTCSGEDIACTWKQTAQEIDANVIAANAAYEGACGGKCETTKGMAKAKLIAAEWRSAERDMYRAKSKMAQLKVAKAEMAYGKACGGKCEKTKSSMQAAVLQANVDAEVIYVAYSQFMNCGKCIDGHNGKLKEARVQQASYEYDAACESGCEKSKAAAQAKIEAIKAGKDCSKACDGEKSAAACAAACKGEKVASKNGVDNKAAMMAVNAVSVEGDDAASTCSKGAACCKSKTGS